MKLEYLENKIEEKDKEIKSLTEKVENMEENAKILKTELKEAIEKSTKIVVKEATEALINIFSKKQDDLEKRNNASLDSFSHQLSTIPNLLLTTGHPHKPPQTSQSHPAAILSQKLVCQKFQCEVFGKTFGSKRTLTNHVRTDHMRQDN